MIDILKYTKLLKIIGKKPEEWVVISSLQGDVVRTYKGNAPDTVTEDGKTLVKLMNHADVFIGNVLFPQPFYLAELLNAMTNPYNLNIAIDRDYLYVLKTGTSYEIDYICSLYDSINKAIKEDWRFKVIRYNLSLRDYITNVNNAVVTQLCKKLGWYYHRQLHGFYKNPMLSVVIPPRELPSFIFQSEEGWVYAKKHIERWKTLLSLYPELRKFNFDVTADDYIPLLSRRKINLDAV